MSKIYCNKLFRGPRGQIKGYEIKSNDGKYKTLSYDALKQYMLEGVMIENLALNRKRRIIQLQDVYPIQEVWEEPDNVAEPKQVRVPYEKALSMSKMMCPEVIEVTMPCGHKIVIAKDDAANTVTMFIPDDVELLASSLDLDSAALRSMISIEGFDTLVIYGGCGLKYISHFLIRTKYKEIDLTNFTPANCEVFSRMMHVIHVDTLKINSELLLSARVVHGSFYECSVYSLIVDGKEVESTTFSVLSNPKIKVRALGNDEDEDSNYHYNFQTKMRTLYIDARHVEECYIPSNYDFKLQGELSMRPCFMGFAHIKGARPLNREGLIGLTCIGDTNATPTPNTHIFAYLCYGFFLDLICDINEANFNREVFRFARINRKYNVIQRGILINRDANGIHAEFLELPHYRGSTGRANAVITLTNDNSLTFDFAFINVREEDKTFFESKCKEVEHMFMQLCADNFVIGMLKIKSIMKNNDTVEFKVNITKEFRSDTKRVRPYDENERFIVECSAGHMFNGWSINETL